MNLILPIPTDRRSRRLVQLFVGLSLFGFSTSLMVESRLGLSPWDVFHQGAAHHAGIGIGTMTIVVAAFVLLLWIPLRQKLGFATLCNAIQIGLVVNLSLVLLPDPRTMAPRVLFLATGIALNGVATGLYIGAGMGAGPRDGLMMGLAARGHSIRIVRTLIEVTVLVVGWLLGGTVGFGTVAYALAIGPLAHIFIPRLTVGRADTTIPPDAHSSAP
jgi:uncharacterized membrane protein YczE